MACYSAQYSNINIFSFWRKKKNLSSFDSNICCWEPGNLLAGKSQCSGVALHLGCNSRKRICLLSYSSHKAGGGFSDTIKWAWKSVYDSFMHIFFQRQGPAWNLTNGFRKIMQYVLLISMFFSEAVQVNKVKKKKIHFFSFLLPVFVYVYLTYLLITYNVSTSLLVTG